ncbi:MAG: AsnC family transcriptional regulator, partial [Clostridia bacterium]|nr:AsnC family transcriptional regulator [Clostridia bacterium]
MDNFDSKILKVLQDDSRFTAEQVADIVGLDAKDTQKRIKSMEESGVIAKYTALCNTE